MQDWLNRPPVPESECNPQRVPDTLVSPFGSLRYAIAHQFLSPFVSSVRTMSVNEWPVPVTLTAISNDSTAVSETAVMTIATGSGYKLSKTAKSATVTINNGP